MSFPVYHINELRVLIALLLVMHLQRWGKLVSAKFLYFKVTIFPFSVDKFFGEDNLKLCKSLFSSNFCALIWHLLVVLICHFMLLLLTYKINRQFWKIIAWITILMQNVWWWLFNNQYCLFILSWSWYILTSHAWILWLWTSTSHSEFQFPYC